MILDNKLNITDQIELAKTAEKISKQKARQLFDSGDINKVEIAPLPGLRLSMPIYLKICTPLPEKSVI